MIATLALLALTMLPQSSQTQKRSPERTVFQTSSTYTDRINIRADVAIVYGFDKGMPDRVKAWRDRGYTVHLMTGVAWGEYQDYYFGRWDGVNHEDEAQTRRNGEKVGHGKDVYYMSPGKNYGKYLAEGVRRALDVGVEAVHLEEPEFWTFSGYSEGFKREWKDYYGEEWQDPQSSPDARWRAAKLMYYLYRRALQQVFDSIQEYNKEKGTHVRCYVPTHSLINYAHWGLVSPESSLARLNGCDGYIAQVWTGTARTPNIYQGVKKERTFETAFLEYGSMQNLVRSTGREVWYLADPIEDDANHDWGDYRRNWESTLIASLLQPEVSQYEVMPWPERIFNGNYPSETNKNQRVPIPDAYELEVQTAINALKDMSQKSNSWDSGSHGIGVMVSDSLMFQRGGPSASDGDFGHFYGLAMPFVKRGMPVQPVQLENVTLDGYLKGLQVILMTYEGMKPLTPDVHDAIVKWVKDGGSLIFVDNDKDPFLKAREWWNTDGKAYATPRQHLFEKLGIPQTPTQESTAVGRGRVVYLAKSPSELSRQAEGAKWLADKVKTTVPNFQWKESAALVLRRGPYVVAAGLDESSSPVKTLKGKFVDLFDPSLTVQKDITLSPSSRHFLVDLGKAKMTVLAAAGSVHQASDTAKTWAGTVEGIADTPCILLLRAKGQPKKITVDGQSISDYTYRKEDGLLWLRFPNQARPQKIQVEY
ncbi:MAG: hypothetical protein J0H02_16570 [Armatimonadetes bacterium]|nr:hypothetical protein [Armatimonadota bacterium]